MQCFGRYTSKQLHIRHTLLANNQGRSEVLPGQEHCRQGLWTALSNNKFLWPSRDHAWFSGWVLLRNKAWQERIDPAEDLKSSVSLRYQGLNSVSPTPKENVPRDSVSETEFGQHPVTRYETIMLTSVQLHKCKKSLHVSICRYFICGRQNSSEIRVTATSELKITKHRQDNSFKKF